MAKRYSSLADYFDRSGRSRQEAAEKWGVSLPTISRWISGSRRLGGDLALTVAEDTGVPLAALIASPRKAA